MEGTIAPTLTNPRDLFLHQLAEALWIERTLAFDVLPRLEREADSELLARPLAEHLVQTREHAERVEQVFLAAGAEPAAAASAPVEALRRRYDETAESVVEPRLRDLFAVTCAQTTEALELALYASIVPLGRHVGVDTALLQRSSDDEQHALEQLERVAVALREKLPS